MFKGVKTKSICKYMEYSMNNTSSNLGTSYVQGYLVSNLLGEKYVANTNKPNTNVVFEPSGSFYSILVDDGSIVDTSNNMDNETEEDDDSKNGTFNFVNDPINTFFIGSITVVGLFVLFRLLQKTKK